MLEVERFSVGKVVLHAHNGEKSYEIESTISPVLMRRLLVKRLFEEKEDSYIFRDLTDLLSYSSLHNRNVFEELEIGGYPNYLNGIITKLLIDESREFYLLEPDRDYNSWSIH